MWFGIENPVVNVIVLPELKQDGSNKADFFVADVIGNHRFAQNYGGYPRSDISIINEQQNMSVAKGLLEELRSFSPVDRSNGADDATTLLGLRSKYCQAPSEVVGYYERELQRRSDERQRAEFLKEHPLVEETSVKSPDDVINDV